MKTWHQLIQLYLNNIKAEDIEYDTNALVMVLFIGLGFNYLNFAFYSGFSEPIFYGVIVTIVQIAVIYGFLTLAQKANRFVQTATAVFGVAAIASTIQVVLVLSQILAIFVFAVVFWTLYIQIQVLKSAMETLGIMAFVVVIFMNVAGYFALMMIFPNFIQEFMQIYEIAAQNTQSK